MKKFRIISILVLVISMAACTKSSFEPFEPLDSGTANFSTYISVGNSLTQGYQSGGLHNERGQQDNSYPAIIARQMQTSFLQPLAQGNGSGYKSLVDL